MKKSVVFSLLGVSLFSCVACNFKTNPSEEDSITREVSLLADVGEVRMLFDSGTIGETLVYNYCPSIFIENDVKHVYYCSNKVEGNVTDYIGYRQGRIVNNSIVYDKQTSYLLEPGAIPSWDSRHTCDPSVIKGEFKFHNETYSYLMAYLGCLTSDCTQNETGIAVSKSPSGPWIKCDFKLDGITPINPIVPFSSFPCDNKTWGTGQPSLVSIDGKGKVLLFTTVGSKTATFTNLREYDFSNIDEYELVREKYSISADGVKSNSTSGNYIANADFAYDVINRRILMAKPRFTFGLDGKEPSGIADTIDVYYIDDTEGDSVGDVLFAGNNTTKTWKIIGSIDESLTGFIRNHNCGLISDEFAHIDSTKNLGVAFTRSNEQYSSDWSSLCTYRLYETSFSFPSKYFSK